MKPFAHLSSQDGLSVCYHRFQFESGLDIAATSSPLVALTLEGPAYGKDRGVRLLFGRLLVTSSLRAIDVLTEIADVWCRILRILQSRLHQKPCNIGVSDLPLQVLWVLTMLALSYLQLCANESSQAFDRAPRHVPKLLLRDSWDSNP